MTARAGHELDERVRLSVAQYPRNIGERLNEWTRMKFDEGKYKSSEIYGTPKDPALKKEYEDSSTRGAYFSAASVGPEVPRGSRLGPDGENSRAASIFGSMSTPTKQFCMSSQF